MGSSAKPVDSDAAKRGNGEGCFTEALLPGKVATSQSETSVVTQENSLRGVYH